MASDLSAFVEDLKRDPELALTADLSDEELLDLQRMLNPYARIAGPARDPARPRAVAVSYTNLREDYIQRFTMTSLVAFLFRMFREYSVEAEQRRWTPPKVKGETRPFTIDEIDMRLVAAQQAVTAAREAEAEFEKAKEAARKFNDEELVFSEEEMKRSAEAAKEGKEDPQIYGKMQEFQNLMRAARDAEGRFWGLRYTLTIMLRNLGIEADLRTLETERKAMEFPNAAKIINEEPDRHRGLLPGGQKEMPEKLAKDIIEKFLQSVFEYDPDAHVRKAYDEIVLPEGTSGVKEVGGLGRAEVDPFDPERLPLQVLLAKAPPETQAASDEAPLRLLLEPTSGAEQQRLYNMACYLLRDRRAAALARYLTEGSDADPDRGERWRRMLLPRAASELVPAVPPQDTFHRWRYYNEVNMEALREVTNTLYHDKPDLDFALAVMDYFEGTPEEVGKAAEAFRDRYQDQLVSDIKTIEFGGWTLLGDFEKNRERVNFYNRGTEVLERILKRHEDDKKLGELMMKKRVRKAKAKNIKESGPDAPGLAEYSASVGAPPGARPVLSDLDRRRLEKAQGDLKAAREIEYYERYEARARALEKKAAEGGLTPAEKDELKHALAEMEKAREMIAVPDDAIQVDVWEMNPGKGEVNKHRFYTEAVKPDENDLEADPAKRVAQFFPEGSRKAGEAALREGKSLPLAPFAQDFLDQELERERETRRGDEEAARAEAQARASGGGASGLVDNLAEVVDQAFSQATAEEKAQPEA